MEFTHLLTSRSRKSHILISENDSHFAGFWRNPRSNNQPCLTDDFVWKMRHWVYRSTYDRFTRRFFWQNLLSKAEFVWDGQNLSNEQNWAELSKINRIFSETWREQSENECDQDRMLLLDTIVVPLLSACAVVITLKAQKYRKKAPRFVEFKFLTNHHAQTKTVFTE